MTALAENRRLIIDGSIDAVGIDPFSVVMMYCRTQSNGTPYACGLMCTGSLITQNTVLTAAHCIRDNSKPFQDPALEISYENTFILLGSSDYDKADWAQNSRIVKVKKATHHGFGSNVRFPFDGDVALLELEECVTIVPGLIETIKIATKSTEPEGGICQDVKAIGFGMVSNAPDPLNDSDGRRRSITDVLHGSSTCRDAYIAAAMDWTTANQGNVPGDVFQTVLPDNFLCTGGASVHSVCYGDSGGPTVSVIPNTENTLQVVGTTSFGFGAVCTLSPDYSSRTSFHADWIHSTLESGTFDSCPGWTLSDTFASWPVAAWSDNDLSDEFKQSRCGIDGSKWQCMSGACIDVAKVCDGQADCSDWSDEQSTYCSYVKTNGRSARRLSEGHDQLLAELDVLIAEGAADDVQVLKFHPDAEQKLKAAANEVSGTVKIVGILKSRALRPKKDKKFWDPSTAAPSGKSAVACSSGLATYETELNKAISANTIDDQWNAVPLVNACNDLLTCSGTSNGGVSSGRSFCNGFLEYVAANSSLTDYASNFADRFSAGCPQDPAIPKSVVPTQTPKGVTEYFASLWVTTCILTAMYIM